MTRLVLVLKAQKLFWGLIFTYKGVFFFVSPHLQFMGIPSLSRKVFNSDENKK